MKVLQRHLLLGGCSVIAYLLMHIYKAKKDWYDIVQGNHSLWYGVARIFF
ncbi:unnamed protein product [Brassica oleracea var. botrytis]